jgi:hypothetical protein
MHASGALPSTEPATAVATPNPAAPAACAVDLTVMEAREAYQPALRRRPLWSCHAWLAWM